MRRPMPLRFFTIRTACHFAMCLLIFCFLTGVGLEWLGISKSRTTFPVLQSPAAKGSPHVGGVFRWSWGQDDFPAHRLLRPDLWLLGFSWLWVPFQGEAGRLSGDPNCTWRVHTKVSRIWPSNDQNSNLYPKLRVLKIQSSFLFKSLFRAYADYQAEWAAGGLMTIFIQSSECLKKHQTNSRRPKVAKKNIKTFLGDDGRPDWVARKTCNYLTGSIEVRDLDF